MRPLSAFCIQSRILAAIRDGAETSQEIAAALGDTSLTPRRISPICALLFAAGKVRHSAVIVYPGCRPSWCYQVTSLGQQDLAARYSLSEHTLRIPNAQTR